jgi:hypothetical protein
MAHATATCRLALGGEASSVQVDRSRLEKTSASQPQRVSCGPTPPTSGGSRLKLRVALTRGMGQSDQVPLGLAHLTASCRTLPEQRSARVCGRCALRETRTPGPEKPRPGSRFSPRPHSCLPSTTVLAVQMTEEETKYGGPNRRLNDRAAERSGAASIKCGSLRQRAARRGGKRGLNRPIVNDTVARSG